MPLPRSLLTDAASAAPVPHTALPRRSLVTETWLVLGLSLGASALWSILSLVNKLTQQVALNQQTTTMNNSVTPERPWLDLAYQLLPIGLGVVPALIAVHLLRRDDPAAAREIGIDRSRPAADLLQGGALTLVIGIPGLLLYLGARAAGLNTTIAAANLTGQWWTIPVLILAAAQNAILEEVVMIGYLLTRWRQAGWATPLAIGVSALIRGGYHLYQGFGGFVGNALMGVLFGLFFVRTTRVLPLVIAHTLVDIAAFVGYTLLRSRVGWL
ncbi:MAG: CPBP family intramembrane glutamic endopeptidase [Tetrasphaera sp.]